MLLPILLLNIQILTFKLCKLELKAHSIIACYNYDSFDIRNYIYICMYICVCTCVCYTYIYKYAYSNIQIISSICTCWNKDN